MLTLAVEFIPAFKITSHELVNTTSVNVPLSNRVLLLPLFLCLEFFEVVVDGFRRFQVVVGRFMFLVTAIF